MSTSQMNPQVWAFGGAKGGVGRSVLCAATAHALVEQGKRVIALDFDLGSANLHTLMGIIQPKNNLEQWILGQVNDLQEVCSPTSSTGLSLISGAASIYNPSHPSPDQLKRLIYESLSLEADYILIDLGAGIHPHTLDFFNVAGRSFIITTPEPTSIQNTYAFYKAALIRRLEVTLGDHPWLRKILQRTAVSKGSARITSLGHLLDMLKELDYEVNRQVTLQLQSLKAPFIINRAYPDDEEQVVQALQRICEQYLQLELEHAITIPEDKSLRSAIRQLIPIHELPKTSTFLKTVREWVKSYIKNSPYTPIQEDFLPLLGTPSFLSMGQTHDRPESIKSSTHSPHETQLVNAIHALHERDQIKANQSQNKREETSQSKTRDWKQIAWPADHPSGESDQYGADPYPYPTHDPTTSTSSINTRDSVSSLEEMSEVIDQGYIEPPSIRVIQLQDPPEHEVISFEEELRTDQGWFHLKTVDLAPFMASIRTLIYQEGERLISFDDSYLSLYESGGAHGTMIAKRVERIHHQNIQLLQKGGISSWWSAHSDPK